MELIVESSLLVSYNDDRTFINIGLEFSEVVYGVLLIRIIYMTPIDFSRDNSKSDILINSTKLSKFNHSVVNDPTNNSLLLIEYNLLKGNIDYLMGIQVRYLNMNGEEVSGSLFDLLKYFLSNKAEVTRVTARLL